MTGPHWMTREECLALHDMMLGHYGGIPGIRDGHMLESALAKPRHLFAYGRPEMAELAAAYTAGIVRNHPFLDGNKRTGFMLGAAFLERNGMVFSAPEAEVVVKTLALAAGEMDDRDYAVWMKGHTGAR